MIMLMRKRQIKAEKMEEMDSKDRYNCNKQFIVISRVVWKGC